MVKKKSDALTPKERATARDNFVRAFDEQFSNWAAIAKCCVDVERDEDWKELGFATYNKWLADAAPRSKSYLYLVIGRYKELAPDIPDAELQEIPLGSAGILKQLSPAVRRQSKIRQAAKSKPSELRQILRDTQPEQHIETLDVRPFRFTESQAALHDEALESYNILHECHITAEEFIEYLEAQWIDSKWEDSPHSNRQRAAQLKAAS